MASSVNRILWWALVASQIVYVVVVYVVSIPLNPEAPIPVIFAAFTVLSLAIGIGTLKYRQYALCGPIQRGELHPATREGQQKAFQAFVTNLILTQSIGIFGFILGILSGQGAYTILFVVASLGLFYVHRPTAPDLYPPVTRGGPEIRPSPIA